MNKIEAPWTPEQVIALCEYQSNPHFHAYTCGNRGDGKHGDPKKMMNDLGVLVPTIRGWECMFCNYTQTWAFEFTSDQAFLMGDM